MLNLKSIATLLAGVALLYSSEISVFDAGNLDSSNPYGLTDSEKVMLKNKQKVDSLSKNIDSVESTLSGAKERIEGIQSVLDGINSRITRLEKRVDELQGVSSSDSSETLSLESLKKSIEETRALQDANNKKITKALKDLSLIIDKINSNYVSKSELDKPSQKPTAKEPKPQASSSADFTKQKIQDIATEAKKMFDGGKLEEAQERYEFLLSKNHKPALANFYLGEISYQQKAYNNAIKYYQQSISLYDKADYTPKLLYHTAISFDKIGDTPSANRFYKALKLGYPDSKEAKASPNR